MLHPIFRRAFVALLALLASPVFAQETKPDDAGPGIKFLSGLPLKNNGYGKSWAVVIGVNYETVQAKLPESARSLVPTLRNAENDAQTLRDVLVRLYGYDPDCVKLLKGAAATKQDIERALNDFKDEAKVKPTDSLLVFFSGHGTRIENEADERGAIYAADVDFTPGGKLKSGGSFRMHKDLLPLLDACPAKHKLLILDCCHSGEIFSLRARSRSEADDRRATSLFEAKGSIQAIASCRDRQRASDGIGANSPFTAALLQGLRRIPAREESDAARIGVNQLFTYMLPELKNLPNGQSPDCRLLGDVDGEFSFFPAATAEARAEFARHRTSEDEFRLLQAMVPGDHGNWWFQEMPWFVPSLRLMILKKTVPDRAALQSSAIRSDELLKLAENLNRELQAEIKAAEEDGGNPVRRKLLVMRLSHFKGLLSKNAKDSQETVRRIVDDFEGLNDEEEEQLSAGDLHLLAVAKHSLHQNAVETEDVDAAYNAALAKFDVTIGNELALKSLCHADYGYFLNIVKRDYPGAAEQFNKALTLFGSDLIPDARNRDMMEDPAAAPKEGKEEPARRIVSGSAPPAFRVFVLCSEAEAWQRQNRWGKANDLLNTALHVARGFDVEHQLMVFVLNKVAWAHMEQWRIDEAEKYFSQANEILANLRSNEVQDPAASTPKLTEKADARGPVRRLMQGSDYNSLERYLHHLHGLAMAKRFRGREREAIEDFRLIVQMTAEALTHLKHGQNALSASGDTERRLLERMINSQERLADCNLFGDPAGRELCDAADDYRRSIHACASLPDGKIRDIRRMSLLYRLAISLSLLPSKIQDVELARAYCSEANDIRKRYNIRGNETVDKGQPPTVEVTLGAVADAIVSVFEEKLAKERDDAPARAPEAKEGALELLRRTIRSQCNQLNGNLHRDQLETLLLGTKVLAEQVPDNDRYHLADDSELLLYLCRIVLPKSAGYADARAKRQEPGAYLHPYFDTVLRTKLRMKPKHVKDLLEIQWEATRGEFYTKPQTDTPVLAVYLLDDGCVLLFDNPGGVSKPYLLDGKYNVSAVKRGCYNAEFRLSLPNELQQELLQLRKHEVKQDLDDFPLAADSFGERKVAGPLQLRWVDPVRGLTEFSTRLSDAGKTEAGKPTLSSFPFNIPAGIEIDAAVNAAAKISGK